jgi:hypothetical protein
VFPTLRDLAHDEMMKPAALKEIVEYVRIHRRDNAPFDVALEGFTPADDPVTASEIVAGHAAAGLTWWVEKLGWFRGPLAEARERIGAGPPTAG